MKKEVGNLKIVQGVNIEFKNPVKRNVTKYLLISDESSEEICNSKAFVDIAFAGKHRGKYYLL